MYCSKEKALKAAYLPNGFIENTELTILGDNFHHLVNVLRVRINDELILLDGKGLQGLGLVVQVGKRELVVKIQSTKRTHESTVCDLLLFTPKKDALETMLKSATELGVRKIYLYRGAFSQEKLPDKIRVDALLQSAMEQSNNPWKPEIIHCSELADCPLDQFDQIHLMDIGSHATSSTRADAKSILVIGPEGGFSDDERKVLKSFKSTHVVSLPTPILRAPTAMMAGLGWWYAQSLKP
jgi:16S rRNA (uracil1498-N3)-methyltransferase